jgi:uncharacterized membrane protein
MNAESKIETYLAEVRACLRSVHAGDEEVVIREVTAHVQQITAKPGATTDSAMEELGPAKEVAGRYRDALLITKAARSNSPLLLLHASLRNGVLGVLAFVAGLAGYWVGGCILVFCMLALLWSAAHYTPNARAAIGASFFQTLITAVLGAGVVVVTTVLLRALLHVSKKRQLP